MNIARTKGILNQGLMCGHGNSNVWLYIIIGIFCISCKVQKNDITDPYIYYTLPPEADAFFLNYLNRIDSLYNGKTKTMWEMVINESYGGCEPEVVIDQTKFSKYRDPCEDTIPCYQLTLSIWLCMPDSLSSTYDFCSVRPIRTLSNRFVNVGDGKFLISLLPNDDYMEIHSLIAGGYYKTKYQYSGLYYKAREECGAYLELNKQLKVIAKWESDSIEFPEIK